MPITRTWILVADGARARVLRAQGHRIETLMELETKIPPARDIVSDRPGRGQRRAHSTTHHGFEDTTDAHREAKHAFVKSLAGAVEGGLKAKAFDNLVVVAPPRVLGDIRQTLGASARRRIVKEHRKDLTRLRKGALEKAVAALVGVQPGRNPVATK